MARVAQDHSHLTARKILVLQVLGPQAAPAERFVLRASEWIRNGQVTSSLPLRTAEMRGNGSQQEPGFTLIVSALGKEENLE